MFSAELNPLYQAIFTAPLPQTAQPAKAPAESHDPPSVEAQRVGAERVQKALSPQSAPWVDEALDALAAAGLSREEATELVLHGVDAERATEMLSMKLLSPKVQNYPQALVAMHLLSKARAQGKITPQEVREAIEGFSRAVVVRPDGMIARALTGKPIERRALKVRGGQLKAGNLVVGQAYSMHGGFICQLHPDFSEGELLEELTLKHIAVDVVLDGAEAAIMAMVPGAG